MLEFLSANIFFADFSPLFPHAKTRHATRDGFNFKHSFLLYFLYFPTRPICNFLNQSEPKPFARTGLKSGLKYRVPQFQAGRYL